MMVRHLIRHISPSGRRTPNETTSPTTNKGNENLQPNTNFKLDSNQSTTVLSLSKTSKVPSDASSRRSDGLATHDDTPVDGNSDMVANGCCLASASNNLQQNNFAQPSNGEVHTADSCTVTDEASPAEHHYLDNDKAYVETGLPEKAATHIDTSNDAFGTPPNDSNLRESSDLNLINTTTGESMPHCRSYHLTWVCPTQATSNSSGTQTSTTLNPFSRRDMGRVPSNHHGMSPSLNASGPSTYPPTLVKLEGERAASFGPTGPHHGRNPTSLFPCSNAQAHRTSTEISESSEPGAPQEGIPTFNIPTNFNHPETTNDVQRIARITVYDELYADPAQFFVNVHHAPLSRQSSDGESRYSTVTAYADAHANDESNSTEPHENNVAERLSHNHLSKTPNDIDLEPPEPSDSSDVKEPVSENGQTALRSESPSDPSDAESSYEPNSESESGADDDVRDLVPISRRERREISDLYAKASAKASNNVEASGKASETAEASNKASDNGGNDNLSSDAIFDDIDEDPSVKTGQLPNIHVADDAMTTRKRDLGHLNDIFEPDAKRHKNCEVLTGDGDETSVSGPFGGPTIEIGGRLSAFSPLFEVGELIEATAASTTVVFDEDFEAEEK